MIDIDLLEERFTVELATSEESNSPSNPKSLRWGLEAIRQIVETALSNEGSPFGDYEGLTRIAHIANALTSNKQEELRLRISEEGWP